MQTTPVLCVPSVYSGMTTSQNVIAKNLVQEDLNRNQNRQCSGFRSSNSDNHNPQEGHWPIKTNTFQGHGCPRLPIGWRCWVWGYSGLTGRGEGSHGSAPRRTRTMPLANRPECNPTLWRRLEWNPWGLAGCEQERQDFSSVGGKGSNQYRKLCGHPIRP